MDMAKGTIRIGTRASKLALWQAYYVEDLLKAAGWDTEIVEIISKGDKILDVSISKIGSKGVFTEELEAQLRDGTIDVAVHSAKDMPSRLPDDLHLIAFSEREQMHDVLVSDGPVDLENPPEGFRIGTSSTRRIALLKHYYPHLTTVDMRGNLQTRLSKLERGDCEALWLAYAGVHRMGYESRIAKALPLDRFIPAVGQGSVTVEVAETLAIEKREAVRASINHPATEQCLLAERAFLRTLEGGCSVPVFGLAQWAGDQIRLEGGVVSLDGQTMLRDAEIGTDPTAIGEVLAQRLLDQGAGDILAQIKAEQQKS